MLKFPAKSFMSMGLRAVILSAKFFVLFIIANYSNTANVGLYGLMTATLYIGVSVIGFEFYLYNTREIIASESKDICLRLRDQMYVHLITYLFAFPLFLIVFYLKLLPWSLISWFYVLLIFEHLCQEANRVLITLEKPMAANLVLFFRSAAWVIILVGLVLFMGGLSDLKLVWLLWLLGDIAAIFVLVINIMTLDWSQLAHTNFNMSWATKGIKVSGLFFCNALFMQLMVFIGRYFLKFYYDLEIVGVYTLFSNLANLIPQFWYSGFLMFVLPKILQQLNSSDYSVRLEALFNFSKTSLIIVALLAVLAAVLIFPLLHFIHKPIYNQYVFVYWLLLLAAIIDVIAQIPHYALYADHLDKKLALCTLLGVITTLIINLLFVERFGIIASVLATLFGYLSMGLLRSYFIYNHFAQIKK